MITPGSQQTAAPRVFDNAAETLCAKRKYAEAIEAYSKALAITPNRVASLIGRGAAHCALGEYQKAIQDLEKAIEATYSPEARYYLGTAYRLSGRREDALASFKKALELKPDYMAAQDGVKFAQEDKPSGWQPENRFLRKTTLSFADAAGMQDTKSLLRELIILPLQNPELAKEYGKRAGGSLILYGPPGCGKTLIAQAAAGEAKASFTTAKLSDLYDMWVGNTEKNVRDLFAAAKNNAPSILFIDEVEAITGTKTGAQRWERSHINQLLVELDELGKSGASVLVIAATNAPWDIDPSFKRAGRFDRLVYVPAPDEKMRQEVFRLACKNLPVSEDIDYVKLAEKTKGHSCASIRKICEDAAGIPWREALEGKPRRKITQADFEAVLSQAKADLSEWFQQAKAFLTTPQAKEAYRELAKEVESLESTEAGGRMFG